jgi:hypothetical protein
VSKTNPELDWIVTGVTVLKPRYQTNTSKKKKKKLSVRSDKDIFDIVVKMMDV